MVNTDTLISICIFTGGFIGLLVWSMLYISRSKAARETLFKKKVVAGLWITGTILVVLPGLLFLNEYISVGWFLVGLYLFLFLSLPFLYWVEQERTKLRWETGDQKRATKGQLGSSLLLFAVSFLFSLPLVYNYFYGGMSFWSELVLAILLMISVYLANRLRLNYMQKRYQVPNDDSQEE